MSNSQQPIVKFKCLIPSVVESYPIVQSKKINFEWVSKARDYYKSNKDALVNTLKCPGIFGIMGTGWIQRTYQDFGISTSENDLGDVVWGTRENQRDLLETDFKFSYISLHGENQLFDFKEFTPGTLHKVVKVQSPWIVEIPDGYSLLCMPVPYNDDNRFTSAIGILKGINFLNVQLYWHKIGTEETVKAGTPIQQYVLLKDEDIDFEVGLAKGDTKVEEFIKNVSELTLQRTIKTVLTNSVKIDPPEPIYIANADPIGTIENN